MSTRANIICYQMQDKELSNAEQLAILYRHMDGYPIGLGNDLKVGLKDCDGDRRLLADLGKMDYPPEFTTCLHGDIEYLYKIYAGFMSHRDDKQAIYITVTPIKWDFKPDEDHQSYRKSLLKPNHEDEIDLDIAIMQGDIEELKYNIITAKKDGTISTDKIADRETELATIQKKLMSKQESIIEQLKEIEQDLHNKVS